MTFVSATQNALNVRVSAADFFGLNGVSRLKPSLEISLSGHSYRPKEEDLRSDWVASVAAPAFRVLASEGVFADRFCAIGTGAGLDALAAIEILRSSGVFITDLHDDVVALAVQNITSNVGQAAVSVRYAVGDLLAPIIANGFKADLIYENLPNIPIFGNLDLSDGQSSSTFIANRIESLPDFVARYLLALHFVAIQTARTVLQPGGRMLSSIGGRLPLQTILKLATSTGHFGRILLYTWKQQSEPDEVIKGYAHWEAAGHGPFTFYPVAILKTIFREHAYVSGSDAAVALEAALMPHALSAARALHMFHNGVPIGHTVAVLESTFNQDGREHL